MHRASFLRPAVVLVVGTLLAACGSGGASGDVTGESAGTAPDDPAPTVAENDAPSDQSIDEPSSTSESTVNVTDVMGEQEVLVTDQGIYALDELMGTLLLTLGVEPVTTGAFFEDPLLEPVLSARSELVEAGSVESVAATMPELVLGIGHPNIIAIADEYAGIAPTVLPDFTSSWQDQTRLVAQVVDREAEANAVIGAVEQRVASLADEVAEAGLTGQRAAVIQNFGPDWFAYGPTTISGAILADLGFTRSDAQSGSDNFGFIPVAAELVPDETDVPWVFGVISTASQDIQPISDDQLVGGDASTVVDVGEAWFNNSALGAWIVLDDLEAALFGRGEITGIDGAADAFEDLLAAADAIESGGTDLSASDDEAAYPVVLPQVYGDEVTIPAPPERIVSLDVWSFDLLTALGVEPVAFASFGPPPAYLPAEAVAATEVLAAEAGLPVEQIAAASPDLIVDLSGFFTVNDPDAGATLEGLAPVLSTPTDAFADSWEERFRHLGAALDRGEDVETIIAEVSNQIADATQDAPQITGAPVTFARYNAGEATFDIVVDESDFTRQFLNGELGLTTPGPQQAAFDAGDGLDIGGGAIQVSLERADLLTDGADAAFVFVAGDPAALDDDPVWNSLELVQDGKIVFVDLAGVFALRVPAPASIDFVITELVPELADAVAR